MDNQRMAAKIRNSEGSQGNSRTGVGEDLTETTGMKKQKSDQLHMLEGDRILILCLQRPCITSRSVPFWSQNASFSPGGDWVLWCQQAQPQRPLNSAISFFKENLKFKNSYVAQLLSLKLHSWDDNTSKKHFLHIFSAFLMWFFHTDRQIMKWW